MGDPIADGARRDLLDDIVAADEAAAKARERKERRVFRIAASAVVVLALAVGLFALLAFTAMNNQREAREAASRRIDLLNVEIRHLGDELTAEARNNSRRIGELTEQVAALQEQVRQLGGEPVVVITRSEPGATTTTTTTSPPPPSTTTTTRPPDDVPPTCFLRVVCLPGRRA